MKHYLTSLIVLFSILTLSGCSSRQDTIKNLSLELPSANECINENKSIQNDCYGLLSQRNSFAQLRLGVHAEIRKDYKEALKRYTNAQKMNNFYATSLIANFYDKGFGVRQDRKKALEMIRQTQDVDPMAAFMLAKHYLKTKRNDKAIKLLEFAGNNDFKSAQRALAEFYFAGKYVEKNIQKSNFWKTKYLNDKNSFKLRIYGLR
ncbi:MAG: hypothetical protein CR967_06000 [Proteobacteria bacterium]|nr:MAG: hypothetical protein CR967_06000 [Pseudomonadota bacterium]